MNWEFDETEASDGLDKEFNMVTLLGVELPEIKDFDYFTRKLKKRILSLFRAYGHIVKGLDETFSEDAELEAEEFMLRMLAVWSQHPRVAEADRLYFKGPGGLEERWNAGKISAKNFAEITPAVNKLVLDLAESIGQNLLPGL